MASTTRALSSADAALGGPRCRLQHSEHKISSTWSSEQQEPATLRTTEVTTCPLPHHPTPH
eukprot:4455950-Pleurochrysis_carterae.AAC.1